MAWEVNISEFIKTIGFPLSLTSKSEIDLNNKLFTLALTHSSYAIDKDLGKLSNNERLEFYGDSVLKLACSKYLYDKFQAKDEGVLSSYRAVLVSDAFLSKYSEEIHLNDFIFVSNRSDLRNERAKATITACAFEAILGAFFIEVGFEPVYAFLETIFDKHLPFVKENILKLNAKATLQEFTQGNSKSLPEYKIVLESGKEHNKIFTVNVLYNKKLVGVGSGKSKKEAEQAAAYDACIKLGVINE